MASGLAVKLRDSQEAALSILCEPDRTFGAVWAEPRAGKTVVCLKWLQHIGVRVAVVVGPKIAETTWRSEAAKWLGSDYRFFPLTVGNKYPEMSQLLHNGLSILFVNYDQFGKLPFKRLGPFLNKCSALVKEGGAMILDESHMIKTPNSVTGKHIRPLASRWKYRLLITGTPVTNPNQIDAVYGQWTFLDPSIRERWPSARDFREYFGEWSMAKGYPELIRPIRQYELHRYLSPNIITMTGAADPVKLIKYDYEVPAETMALNKAMLKDGVVEVDGHTIAGLNPLVRLLRMRTVVAGWAKDDADITFTVPVAAKARLRALGRVLKQTDGKVIVAATHLHEIRLIRWYLRRKGIGHHVITGATKDKGMTIERFQYRSEKVLVVQPRTVSMAVDISVANDLVWYTCDFNYVTFKQTSDRIKLAPHGPTVWFLCGQGSVDEDVWATLQDDHDHLHKLVAHIRKLSSASSRPKRR